MPGQEVGAFLPPRGPRSGAGRLPCGLMIGRSGRVPAQTGALPPVALLVLGHRGGPVAAGVTQMDEFGVQTEFVHPVGDPMPPRHLCRRSLLALLPIGLSAMTAARSGAVSTALGSGSTIGPTPYLDLAEPRLRQWVDAVTPALATDRERAQPGGRTGCLFRRGTGARLSGGAAGLRPTPLGGHPWGRGAAQRSQDRHGSDRSPGLRSPGRRHPRPEPCPLCPDGVGGVLTVDRRRSTDRRRHPQRARRPHHRARHWESVMPTAPR